MREILRYWPAAAFGVPALGGWFAVIYGAYLDMKHNAVPGAEQIGLFSKNGNFDLNPNDFGVDEYGAFAVLAAFTFYGLFYRHLLRKVS